MALRKQVAKDATKSPSGNQPIGNVQEDDDGDNNDELSSSPLSPLLSRDKRRREKENKSKPKEMTEEEMMDLALRLSEQEASVAALRQQKEEEAMMKAIQESMDSQTQPSSQSLLDDADAPLRICSRRKLAYSNGKPISAIDQSTSEGSCTPQTDLNRGAKRRGDGDARGFLGLESNANKKPRRQEGSPLLEMPDLSQSQKNDSQASLCSSDVPDLPLDSPQSSDSTQIEDGQLCKSPVFPLTGCRPVVHVPRLSQDLLQTCRTSGFVWCSQDSLSSPQKPLLAQPRSPTFPKSRKLSNDLSLLKSTASPKSPVPSETDQGEDRQTQPSPECVQSPVFGRNTQHENSQSTCKLQVGVCNSGFTLSSQESLASPPRSTTCRSKSPVFPRSPSPPSESSATCKSPLYSETDGGQTEQSNGPCTSPASSRTGQKSCLDVQKHSASPSPAELRDSGGEGNSDSTEGPSQRPRQDSEFDHNQNVLNKSSKSDGGEEELQETVRDREPETMEQTRNASLFWSEEDDDLTPVDEPSPVFPEERPAHHADGQPASPDHVTAASPVTTALSSPSSSSTSTGPRQPSAAQQEPISSQETASRASAPPGSTVHYYWGVPFCPRGLDPDGYTQVILAQMEVYEKSLKQAQRCLLRKAEWGEAVLPQPEKSPSSRSPAESPQQLFPPRRGLQLRSKKLCDADDAPPAEADGNKEEEEERESKEEGKKNEGEGQVESDDCEICPETQLSDKDDYGTQDLMMDTDRGPELRPKSPELPEVEMILHNDSPAEEERQNEVEVEVDEDQKINGSTPVRSSDIRGQHVRREEVEEDKGGPDVMEMKDRRPQGSMSPDFELAVVSQNPETSMDCPICQGSFPVTEIEMHAAYCDGEVSLRDTRRPKVDSFQASLKPRRKRTRKAEETAEDRNDTSNPVRNQEKCHICQKLVPLRDYSRHTELCIRQQGSKTTAKGNLLSALEKMESRNSGAGPSGSKLQPRDVIDLRDDDDDDDCEEGGLPVIRISNSPIRSFTPISEAVDCLVDFKKQYRTKKLRQRPR